MVGPGRVRPRETALPEGVLAEDAEVFDRLYERIHEGRALDPGFVEILNGLDRRLRPRILELQASARFEAVRRMLEERFDANMPES